jgi:calcineurin-like phosphoesterase family protein
MNNKPTFFTSDWHCGHENAIKFDNRPFGSLHEMHETLIARYNATVPKTGICYFLGDMGNKTEDIRKVISRLNGIKVLLLGNHDKGMITMYNCKFDVVLYHASIYIGNNLVTMSHCPLRGVLREDTSNMRKSVDTPFENWHGESRLKHQKSSINNEGQYHLHGHIHSHIDKSQSVKILDKQYDVGIVANKYTPVSLSTIESWINLDKLKNV